MGQLLTYREVGLREFNEGMEYTWCPLKNGFAMLKMSQEELMLGPQADDMAFCVDSKDFTDRRENPGRYVNGAKTKEQCELVNLKMCELGRVMCLGYLGYWNCEVWISEQHQICLRGGRRTVMMILAATSKDLKRYDKKKIWQIHEEIRWNKKVYGSVIHLLFSLPNSLHLALTQGTSAPPKLWRREVNWLPTTVAVTGTLKAVGLCQPGEKDTRDVVTQRLVEWCGFECTCFVFHNDIMFDSFVLFCWQWGFFASMKSWPSQENGTKIDLVFAVGRFCPEASAYEDFRSQSLRKWNQHREIGEIRRNPSASVSMQKLHFSLSISSIFPSFGKANVRRLNWLHRCISLTLLQRTNVDVDLSCCHQSVSHVRRLSSCPRILQNRKTYKTFWKN